MVLPTVFTCVLLSLALSATAQLHLTGLLRPPPPPSLKVADKTKWTIRTIEQFIDHDRPELGTFTQRYVYSTQFYKGPGSPIILVPSAYSWDGYQYTAGAESIVGHFAKAVGAAAIVLEQRYYGKSSPVPNLRTENMKYLTLANSLADLNHFSRTVKLPFDPRGLSKPTNAPWIVSGCSLAGAFSSWTEATTNHSFWAFHSSSGPVESIQNYWEYWGTPERYLDEACVKAQKLAIGRIDHILSTGSLAEKANLKKRFLLGGLKDADFATVLLYGIGIWQYQPGLVERDFCRWLCAGGKPNAHTKCNIHEVNVETALKGMETYIKRYVPNYCHQYYPGKHFNGKYNVDCFKLSNASNPIYNDVSIDNNRLKQFTWFLCNEPFAWTQGTRQDGKPHITSKFLTTEAINSRFIYDYPPTKDGFTCAYANGARPSRVNAVTGGWNHVPKSRYMSAQGELDPWRQAGASSDYRPGGPVQSTNLHSVYLYPGGSHCPDYYPPSIKTPHGKIAAAQVAQMKRWVEQYYNLHGKKRRS